MIPSTIGFNYKFDALNPEGEINELNRAFNLIFGDGNRFDFWGLLQAFFPVLRVLVSSWLLFNLSLSTTLALFFV